MSTKIAILALQLGENKLIYWEVIPLWSFRRQQGERVLLSTSGKSLQSPVRRLSTYHVSQIFNCRIGLDAREICENLVGPLIDQVETTENGLRLIADDSYGITMVSGKAQCPP